MAAPTINYTARDYDAILAELTSFVQATRPEDFTDFFASNLGVTLMELVAYVTDLLSYGQDTVAQEVFLSTARRYDSAIRFARSVGYVPRSAVSATVLVTATVLPDNTVTFGGTIPKGAFITGINARRYELVEDTTIAAGLSTVTFTLREGQSFTDTFTPTKSGRQEFVTAQGIVENDSWSVYVGDPNDSTKLWTQVANIAFETSDTQTYEVFFDGDGKLHVLFGDGTAGKIPDDVITVQYRTTNGAAGNAAAGTIRGSLQAGVLGFTTTVSINVANTSSAAVGGQDRETVEELRVSIPTYIRSLDKVITLLDYQNAVKSQTTAALSFADVPVSSGSGNVVRVNVWSQEQFTFVSTSPGQGTTSAVAYDRYVQSTKLTVFDVQSYLKTRTMATVHNVVINPTVAQVDLDLGQIRYNTLSQADTVHAGVVAAVTSLFESSSGFAIKISDLYAEVLKVPGVISFTITSAIFEHVDFTTGLGTVVEEFRTDQDAAGLNGGPFLPLNDLSIAIPAVQSVAFYDDSFVFNDEILFGGTAIDASAVQAINLRSLVFTLIAA